MGGDLGPPSSTNFLTWQICTMLTRGTNSITSPNYTCFHLEWLALPGFKGPRKLFEHVERLLPGGRLKLNKQNETTNLYVLNPIYTTFNYSNTVLSILIYPARS